MIGFAEKQRLAEAAVYLNGERAKVTGTALRFATVHQIGSGLAAEWSWEAARHIIDNRHGRFES